MMIQDNVKKPLTIFIVFIISTLCTQAEATINQIIVFKKEDKIQCIRATSAQVRDNGTFIKTATGDSEIISKGALHSMVPIFSEEYAELNPTVSLRMINHYNLLFSKYESLKKDLQTEQDQWRTFYQTHQEALEEINVLLSKPAQGSFTVSEAQNIIDTLKAKIPLMPNRDLEIKAYLIPFENLILLDQLEKEQTTSLPLTSNTNVFTRSATTPGFVVTQKTGEKPKLHKVSKIDESGIVTKLTLTSGEVLMFQKGFIIAKLEDIDPDAVKSPDFDAQAAITRYEKFINQFPDLASEIKPIIERIQTIRKEMEQEVEAPSISSMANISSNPITSLSKLSDIPSYRADYSYTRNELAMILIEINLIRVAFLTNSKTVSKIDTVASPFRQHFNRLLQGYEILENKWMNQESIQKIIQERQLKNQLEAEARQKALAQVSDIKMEAKNIEQTVVFILIFILLLSLGSILFIVTTSLKSKHIDFIQIVSCGGAILVLVAYGVVGYFILNASDPIPAIHQSLPKEENVAFSNIEKLVYLSSDNENKRIKREDLSINISQDELNLFLKKNLRYVNDPKTTNFNIYRTNFAVEFQQDRIIMYEKMRCFGKEFTVKYSLPIYYASNGQMGFRNCIVEIGKLPVPNMLANRVWQILRQDWSRILNNSNILTTYTLDEVNNGSLVLGSLFN
ncbi:MAG: hypothetical protein AAF984_02465 [Verrucomicrobiota bacterium]